LSVARTGAQLARAPATAPAEIDLVLDRAVVFFDRLVEAFFEERSRAQAFSSGCNSSGFG
jgi:hypothetical protein